MRYKWWLFLSIFLFGGGLIFGLATSASTIGLLAEDLTALKELAEFLAPLPQPSILAIIYGEIPRLSVDWLVAAWCF
ncbi:MAG: hypothetical protein HYU83_00965 [Chloroflexi bacterium]|nr:hypothetical protein [Chloroflexota bacterium]